MCSASNDCSFLAGIMINAPIFTIFALFPDTNSFKDALYGSIRGLGGVGVRPFSFLWLYELAYKPKISISRLSVRQQECRCLSGTSPYFG